MLIKGMVWTFLFWKWLTWSVSNKKKKGCVLGCNFRTDRQKDRRRKITFPMKNLIYAKFISRKYKRGTLSPCLYENKQPACKMSDTSQTCLADRLNESIEACIPQRRHLEGHAVNGEHIFLWIFCFYSFISFKFWSNLINLKTIHTAHWSCSSPTRSWHFDIFATLCLFSFNTTAIVLVFKQKVKSVWLLVH